MVSVRAIFFTVVLCGLLGSSSSQRDGRQCASGSNNKVCQPALVFGLFNPSRKQRPRPKKPTTRQSVSPKKTSTRRTRTNQQSLGSPTQFRIQNMNDFGHTANNQQSKVRKGNVNPLFRPPLKPLQNIKSKTLRTQNVLIGFSTTTQITPIKNWAMLLHLTPPPIQHPRNTQRQINLKQNKHASSLIQNTNTSKQNKTFLDLSDFLNTRESPTTRNIPIENLNGGNDKGLSVLKTKSDNQSLKIPKGILDQNSTIKSGNLIDESTKKKHKTFKNNNDNQGRAEGDINRRNKSTFDGRKFQRNRKTAHTLTQSPMSTMIQTKKLEPRNTDINTVNMVNDSKFKKLNTPRFRSLNSLTQPTTAKINNSLNQLYKGIIVTNSKNKSLSILTTALPKVFSTFAMISNPNRGLATQIKGTEEKKNQTETKKKEINNKKAGYTGIPIKKQRNDQRLRRTTPEPIYSTSDHPVTLGIPLKQAAKETLSLGIPLKQDPKETVILGIPLKQAPKETVTLGIPLKQAPTETVTLGIPLKQAPKETLTLKSKYMMNKATTLSIISEGQKEHVEGKTKTTSNSRGKYSKEILENPASPSLATTENSTESASHLKITTMKNKPSSNLNENKQTLATEASERKNRNASAFQHNQNKLQLNFQKEKIEIDYNETGPAKKPTKSPNKRITSTKTPLTKNASTQNFGRIAETREALYDCNKGKAKKWRQFNRSRSGVDASRNFSLGTTTLKPKIKIPQKDWTSSDSRVSAVGIGSIGVVVILSIICGVICLDAATLYRDAKRIRKKIYRIFRPLNKSHSKEYSVSKKVPKWAHFVTTRDA